MLKCTGRSKEERDVLDEMRELDGRSGHLLATGVNDRYPI